jgi:hypothetical protein
VDDRSACFSSQPRLVGGKFRSSNIQKAKGYWAPSKRSLAGPAYSCGTYWSVINVGVGRLKEESNDTETGKETKSGYCLSVGKNGDELTVQGVPPPRGTSSAGFLVIHLIITIVW